MCPIHSCEKRAKFWNLLFNFYYCFSKHAAVGIVAPLDKQNCKTDKFENELDPPEKKTRFCHEMAKPLI